jgi:2-polyprenyl-3-methyl-5-hydroxy-6-metoxy-1,4-benzoquinol methylase
MLMEVMPDVKQSHAAEVAGGERFEFGKNWSRFLNLLSEERIRQAETSLREMLEQDDLRGKTFLDIGSGSGLFSLAARRLGARVYSFDFDSDSYACTKNLREKFFPDDENWTVRQGSVLDREYVASLGKFDVVYSWGVLHHTGEMWRALENAALPCKPGGRLFIAIYNDTGNQAVRWKAIKKFYNRLPKFLRKPFAVAVVAPEELKSFLSYLFLLKPKKYFDVWTKYASNRGMSYWHDIIDWVGGYPYEYAAPEEIFEFYKARGFRLTKLKCKNVGLGCNEFVFEKENE